MGFPLPIRSSTTVDCSTPLHVDTNIEYTLDMEKFPEINEPSHYWQPVLMIDSRSYLPDNIFTSSSEMTSSFMSEGDEELFHLIDTYAIHDLQEDDLDFGFVNLAPSSSDSVSEPNDLYQGSCFPRGLTVHSVLSAPDMDESGFVSDMDEDCLDQSYPKEVPLTCHHTARAELHLGNRGSKRAVADMLEETRQPATLSKRRKVEVSYQRVQSLV